MNREIKFRVVDPITGKKLMGEPLSLSFENIGGVGLQYTGLKDKNGTPIYEGDILVVDKDPEGFNPWLDGGRVVVAWSNAFAGFLPFVDYDGDCGHFVSDKNVSVIGNIYENPELLKGAE